jgi:hypothetical protein
MEFPRKIQFIAIVVVTKEGALMALMVAGLSGAQGGGSPYREWLRAAGGRQWQRCNGMLAWRCYSETGEVAKWAQPGTHNTFLYLFKYFSNLFKFKTVKAGLMLLKNFKQTMGL